MLTYHRFATVLPSRVSVPLLNHTPLGCGSLGVVVVEFTASRNRLATEHICQCSGMDAGGSIIRVLTGVRSPGKTGVRNARNLQNRLLTHHASRRRGPARGPVLGELVGILGRPVALLLTCV